MFAQTVRATRQRAFYMPLLPFLPLLAQAVLLAGGNRVVNGELTLGAFVAFNVYLLTPVWPLRMLGYWISEFQRAIASGERIFEIIDEPEEVVERPDAEPCHREKDACASSTCRSGTTTTGPCSRTSTSTSSPARRSR